MDLWSPLNCQVQTSENRISWMWCICVCMELNASFTDIIPSHLISQNQHPPNLQIHKIANRTE
ncbi:predicted protein [Botrytis cinerea T4]|uniref:Uncharacterized protein n=1 Tax=Botryotinia fuckeliana (strain T4) TaxID=999810 RepID=G2YN34_BOTF4|nr:predicted protein [Botrytis cinerea T4]